MINSEYFLFIDKLINLNFLYLFFYKLIKVVKNFNIILELKYY